MVFPVTNAHLLWFQLPMVNCHPKNTLESHNSVFKHVLLWELIFSHSISPKKWSSVPCIHDVYTLPTHHYSAVILVNKTPGQLFLCPGICVKVSLFYMIMAPKHWDSNSKGAARSLSVRGNTNSDPMGQHYRVYGAGLIKYIESSTLLGSRHHLRVLEHARHG